MRSGTSPLNLAPGAGLGLSTKPSICVEGLHRTDSRKVHLGSVLRHHRFLVNPDRCILGSGIESIALNGVDVPSLFTRQNEEFFTDICDHVCGNGWQPDQRSNTTQGVDSFQRKIPFGFETIALLCTLQTGTTVMNHSYVETTN